MDGYSKLQDETGCKLACKRTIYPLTLTAESPSILFGQNAWNSSVFILSYQPSNKINRQTEFYTYTSSNFITDVGGNLGLFLGLSGYGVFKMGLGKLAMRLSKLSQGPLVRK